MIDSVQRHRLTKLHTAMMESLDVAQLEQLCQAMDCPYRRLVGTEKRDKIRELILWCQRRKRVPELAELCQQLQPGFHWQDRPLVVGAIDVLNPPTPERVVATLANRFSQNDLRQLCFYLGVDFESVPGRPDVTRWAENFVSYCQRQGLWAEAVSICLYLRPEAFQDGAATGAPD